MESVLELLRQLTPLESAFALGFSLAAVLFGINQAHTPTIDHQVDVHRAELAAEDAAAEAGYQDMLAHPESVVDAQDLF